jgi:hypothetical protein
MMSSRAVAVCVYLGCLAANPTSASVSYSYTGNNYEIAQGIAPLYETSMRVTATLELVTPLQPNMVEADIIPTHFLINDGVNTITENSDLEEQIFRYSTDAFGTITFWNVSARTALPSPSNVGDQQWEIATSNPSSGLQADYGSISTCVLVFPCGIFAVESGQIHGNPGQRTLVALGQRVGGSDWSS